MRPFAQQPPSFSPGYFAVFPSSRTRLPAAHRFVGSMAHRVGLRVSYDRPQPPSLNVQGRSLPKIIGQVRTVRRLWAEEEERLDKEELEAFERLERIEHQLEADLEARENAATETERNELGEGRRGAPARAPVRSHGARRH